MFGQLFLEGGYVTGGRGVPFIPRFETPSLMAEVCEMACEFGLDCGPSNLTLARCFSSPKTTSEQSKRAPLVVPCLGYIP